MSEDKFLAHFKAEFLEAFDKRVESERHRLNVSLEELYDLYLTWDDLQNSLPKDHELSSAEIFEMLLVKHHKKSMDLRQKRLENEADSHPC